MARQANARARRRRARRGTPAASTRVTRPELPPATVGRAPLARPATAARPALTVVAAWDGDPDALTTWLHSVDAQTLPASLVEVVVVIKEPPRTPLPRCRTPLKLLGAQGGDLGRRVRAAAQGTWMVSADVTTPLPQDYLANHLGQLIDAASAKGHGAVTTVRLEYPIVPEPRWGWGKPANPHLVSALAEHTDHYAALCDTIVAQRDVLATIPRDGSAAHWRNAWFSGLDAASLVGILAARRPSRFVEIGSGNSTLFARHTIDSLGLPTRLTSIDPEPRADIDELCDDVVRTPAEDIDPTFFDCLAPGDILFVDNSHHVSMNADGAAVFFDILPRLPKGVWVHIHDVFLPDDYPPQWADRFYAEQYVLAGLILGGGSGGRYAPRFPVHYVANEPMLASRVAPLWGDAIPADTPRGGGSFWLEIAS